MTGIIGPQIWGNFLRALVMLVMIVCQSMFVFSIMRKVLKGNKQKLRALALLLPITLVVLLSLVWVHTEFYMKYPALVLLTTGLQFYSLTIKMIIATVTKVKFL